MSLGVNFDEVMSDSINGPNFAARPQIDRLWMFVSVWIFLLGLILSNLGLFSIFNGIATLLDPHTSNTTSIVVPFLYAVSFFCVGPTAFVVSLRCTVFTSRLLLWCIGASVGIRIGVLIYFVVHPPSSQLSTIANILIHVWQPLLIFFALMPAALYNYIKIKKATATFRVHFSEDRKPLILEEANQSPNV